MNIRKRSEVQATELDDADILEVLDPKPLASGTFPAALLLDEDELTPTTLKEKANDLLIELAKLTDLSKTPQVCGSVRWNELDREEAWIITVALSNFTVEATLEASPFGADRTIEVLARLVTNRVLVLR